MPVTVNHVVVGVCDLVAAVGALQRAHVPVEAGWTLEPHRSAARVAGPWGAVLLLVEGADFLLAVEGEADEAAGVPWQETWTSPQGVAIEVSGVVDEAAHAALVEPVTWPPGAPDAGVLREVAVGLAAAPSLDLWLSARGSAAYRHRHDANTESIWYGLDAPGHARVDLTLSRWVGADPSALVVGLTVEVATAVPGDDRAISGIEVSVVGDLRSHRGGVLLESVARAYATTPGARLEWPDPRLEWAQNEAPEAAYSRVSEPQRYRVIPDRVDAWLAALTERGIARVEHLDPADYVSSRIVRPVRAGAVPFLVHTSRLDGGGGEFSTGDPDTGGGPAVVVTFAAGDRTVIEVVPDCGCDACDSGSRDLLECVDERILQFLEGGPVHASGPWGTKTWNLNGWQGSGDVERLEEAMGEQDPRVRVVRGEPWL